jgi:hypothetical protein
MKTEICQQKRIIYKINLLKMNKKKRKVEVMNQKFTL